MVGGKRTLLLVLHSRHDLARRYGGWGVWVRQIRGSEHPREEREGREEEGGPGCDGAPVLPVDVWGVRA